MKRLIPLAVVALWLAGATVPPQEPESRQTRLPSGKLQTDVILEDDHRKSLEDVAEIIRLAEDLKTQLEKDEHRVLSVQSVRSTEKIEQLARRVRRRMQRF